MFNLTVNGAHTFYVGHNGWLVHNCDEEILFGQKRIAPNFSTIGSKAPDYIVGRSIEDVASDLRSGVIQPEQIRIDVFRDPRTGQLVAANNRGLAALTEAGFKPTNIVLRDPTKEELNRLLENPIVPGGTLPGRSIAVTLEKNNPAVIRIISIP